MQKEVPTVLVVVAIAVVVALFVFFVIKSGQPPTSGITDHTKYRAPAGLPQPPWTKKQAGGGVGAAPAARAPAPE